MWFSKIIARAVRMTSLVIVVISVISRVISMISRVISVISRKISVISPLLYEISRSDGPLDFSSQNTPRSSYKAFSQFFRHRSAIARLKSFVT